MNKRRRAITPLSGGSRICLEAADNESVKSVFGSRFNNNLDSVIMLFEKSSSMTKEEVEKKIRAMAACVTTGQIYNADDSRFFGGFTDQSSMIENILMREGEVVELPFVTGVYHREAIELATSKLCEQPCVKEVFSRNN